MHPLEIYLSHIAEIRWTGGAGQETSFYGALENLFDEVGKTLKPRVRCVPQVRDTGAGKPDFGFYSKNQFLKGNDDEPLPGVMPERGVVEVKGIQDDSFLTADGDQVSKYGRHYGLVLVTNYRDFVLVEKDPEGKSRRLETFRLAESEEEFRRMLAHPRAAADKKGERLFDYLRRVMLHSAPLDDPEQLAWYLAAYAREAKARIEERGDLPGLKVLRKALEDTLGLQFEGEEGDAFFRATLVQTLFYGIFSAWVLWAREQPAKAPPFNWHEAAYKLKVPIIAGLFEQIAMPSKLQPLGLDEVLDWTGDALSRVVRSSFFQKFEQEHAVQYFYEPFLKAYDPKLRKDLGVWYTPPEIVKYQVERVDMVLREELGLADGLADPSVYVLDPCCGTGAYLVEVIKKIYTTLKDSGKGALLGQELKTAALSRVFGFEILPAPFVVAHLQLGLLLSSLGAPMSDQKKERAGVYLTNALTGWEPLAKPKDLLPFPEMEEEKEAAAKIKQETPVLVILGNPPYNAFAGTSPEEEGGLVDAYKQGLTTPIDQGGWGIKKFNLDDLYVRFFRIAERRIVKSGRGIVSFISNFSYLSGPSFAVMREKILEEFDRLWFDCMNGDSRETGKLTPEGLPDPSVFSTEQNKEGIRVGTAICMMVRKSKRANKPKVSFRHYWGAGKRQDLLAGLKLKRLDHKYQVASPDKQNRYSFRLSAVSRDYLSWPLVSELSALPSFNGPVERRGNSLIVMPEESHRLEQLRAYLDPGQSDDEIKLMNPAFMKSSGEFDASKARALLKGAVTFKPDNMVQYPFKPFDTRLAYLDAALQPLFSRPSPQLLKQRFDQNVFFITRDTADKDPEGPPFYLSSLVCDYDFISGHTRHFPIRLMNGERLKKGHHRTLIDIIEDQVPVDETVANLSSTTREYLKLLRLPDPDKDAKTAALVWMNALAIGFSAAYLGENADGIRQDWPRIPLPNDRKRLESSAAIGREVASLLDAKTPLSGVTKKPRPEIKLIGVICYLGGGQLDPDGGDLDLTAGWGHGGKDGVCMPGRGRIEPRPYSSAEMAAIEAGAKALGLTTAEALAALGNETHDVYLNDRAYWSNIPDKVWEFYIGGYQVIKKWLSYREKSILGRGMTMEEVQYVTEMARRLAALCLLTPKLDRNYEKVKANTYPWPKD